MHIRATVYLSCPVSATIYFKGIKLIIRPCKDQDRERVACGMLAEPGAAGSTGEGRESVHGTVCSLHPRTPVPQAALGPGHAPHASQGPMMLVALQRAYGIQGTGCMWHCGPTSCAAQVNWQYPISTLYHCSTVWKSIIPVSTMSHSYLTRIEPFPHQGCQQPKSLL